mmetsp:Transcript_39045/g.38663  ORF Transcript_39045/g.38663 Transcript_39045/m.38663 type:complete len:250 (-) Transcript_39045:211-960(-)
MSYQKHHAPSQQVINEGEEYQEDLKVIRPLQGIESNKHQPIVRANRDADYTVNPPTDSLINYLSHLHRITDSLVPKGSPNKSPSKAVCVSKVTQTQPVQGFPHKNSKILSELKLDKEQQDLALVKASRSNDSFEGKPIGQSRKSSGHARRKSGVKAPKHKHNKSVVEKVDDDDMDKIIHDLKYFKEHMQANKRTNKGNKRVVNKEANESAPKKGKESVGESGENTTAASQQASRPRTSRGNLSKSKGDK